MNFKKLLIVLSLLFAAILTGCISSGDDKENKVPTENKNVEVTKSTKTILEGTIYQTTAYYFKTNVEGPKILIVGGIHGDELAGWHAASQMLLYNFTFGEVIIIPKANILATQLQKRYPGQGTNGIYDGIKYTDLNRAFPGKIDGTKTQQIAYALASFVDEEDPDIVLDLHESLKSYADGYLGNQVIYSNSKSALYALELVEEFNSQYITPNNLRFRAEGGKSVVPTGSINEYCSLGNTRIVFTLETDRRLDLDERINQQITLIDIFLSQIKPK